MSESEKKVKLPIQPDPREPRPQLSRAEYKRIIGMELLELAKRKDLFR